MSMPASTPQSQLTSLWHPSLRWTTTGALVLVLLSAFESMAVTTVMPIVAADLDGENLYSVAFSATMAAAVIAMVVSGRWSDRSGPTAPLIAAVTFFLAGLLVAGTATAMPILVIGRFLQGLGSGAITVTLYVVVARRYPPALHPRVFGMFAAAWVIPSMIGPFFAGVINDLASWHWVFLGVALFVLPALGLLGPSLAAVRGPVTKRVSSEQVESTDKPAQIRTSVAVILAVLVAVGLVAAGSLAEMTPGAPTWLGAAAILLAVAFAVHWLLPRGTLRARPGLPATILLRGTITAAYFGTEVYLPRMLQEEYGLSASLAGLVLTVGAVSWSTGSAVQARLGARVRSQRLLMIGSVIVVAGITIELITALADFGPAGALLGWLVAGLGMGLAFPRITTLTLGFSTPQNQGFNSSALAVSDAVGGSAATAVTGLLFVTVGQGLSAFAACFILCLAVGVISIWVARRAGRGELPDLTKVVNL